jgi:hypothetical protein
LSGDGDSKSSGWKGLSGMVTLPLIIEERCKASSGLGLANGLSEDGAELSRCTEGLSGSINLDFFLPSVKEKVRGSRVSL